MPELLDPLFLSFQTALVGRYSLERELGRGGMGIVYLAREVRLDRPVAIKLLGAAPELRGDREAAQRRLAQAVAALESIRLDLLRLRGGVGSVETITADLSAAREVGDQIDRLLEGQREVQEALDGERRGKTRAGGRG